MLFIRHRTHRSPAEIIDAPLLVWPTYAWMGLDAEDNPLILINRSTRNLYGLDWEAP